MAKKVNNLRVSRVKSVDTERLGARLQKRITARKEKYGVVLTSYTHEGFSENDAIIIAEALKMTYNGKCIR